MAVHGRSLARSCGGLVLVVVGFVVFVLSYFLLPLYVTTLNCFDSCTPPKYATAWQSSLNVLSRLLPYASLASTCFLVLLWLPLLAAATVLGCSVGFVGQPRRAFATGIRLGLLAGSGALVISLVLYLVLLVGFIRPDFGYLGMLVGYGLFWGGSRLLVARDR